MLASVDMRAMSKPIIFHLPDGRKVVLSDEVFALDRERKVSAIEQAVLLRIVFPEGASGIPDKLPQAIAHLKHKKLLKEAGEPTEHGEYLANVLIERGNEMGRA
ncbi:MAG: hypothetical protein JWN24_1878 [Phycisphaerales bacterium]|nr:hypothetical protein [Phycisphaerales bacterium]